MTSSDRFRDWRRVGVALLVSMMPLGFGPTSALAQPSTRCANVRRVRGIAFAGSPLFDDVTLLASIATQAPTFVARTLHLKSLPCSDSLSVRLDALRIAVLHRQAGWLQAVVSVTSDTSARGVRLRFEIMPGTPTIIDTVRLNGLPVSETVRRSVEGP